MTIKELNVKQLKVIVGKAQLETEVLITQIMNEEEVKACDLKYSGGKFTLPPCYHLTIYVVNKKIIPS